LTGGTRGRSADAIVAAITAFTHIRASLVDGVIAVVIIRITDLFSVVETGPRVRHHFVDHIEERVDVIESVQSGATTAATEGGYSEDIAVERHQRSSRVPLANRGTGVEDIPHNSTDLGRRVVLHTAPARGDLPKANRPDRLPHQLPRILTIYAQRLDPCPLGKREERDIDAHQGPIKAATT